MALSIHRCGRWEGVGWGVVLYGNQRVLYCYLRFVTFAWVGQQTCEDWIHLKGTHGWYMQCQIGGCGRACFFFFYVSFLFWRGTISNVILSLVVWIWWINSFNWVVLHLPGHVLVDLCKLAARSFFVMGSCISFDSWNIILNIFH